jgi:hypothetical protein
VFDSPEENGRRLNKKDHIPPFFSGVVAFTVKDRYSVNRPPLFGAFRALAADRRGAARI